MLIGVAGWFFYSYGYIEDDAFIHLEFARSLGEGHGFAFNGQPVNGDTAPLWVFLLVAFHALGLGWIASAKALDAMGVGLALIGVWRIARDLVRLSLLQHHLVPAALLMVSVNPFFVHWSFSGMEAVTALGVSLWVIWAAFSPLDLSWQRTWVGALLLSIAPLLRPELSLLAAISGPVFLFHSWQLGSQLKPARRLLVLISLGVVMALPALLWAAYAIHSFGAVVPTTNAAKRGGGLVPVATQLASVYLVGFGTTFALIPFVAKRLVKPKVPLIIWVLLLWPLACATFYLVDHTSVQTRYCLLSMPCFALAVLWLLAEARSTVLMRSGFAAIMVVSILELTMIVFPHVANKVRLVKNVSDAVEFIRGSLPPDAPIAVYGIGQFAFESRHPLIDIGGITRPGVLPYLGDLPATIRWAEAQGAQYYIGGDSPEPGSVRLFSYSNPFLGWSFHRSRYDTEATTGIYRLASTTVSSYP